MAIQEEMRINSNLLFLPILPTEITIDILSRLSVESVLSWKLVCKTWRALIDNPVFAQAHTYRFLLDDDDDDDDEKQQQQKPEAFEFFLSPHTDFGQYNFGEHTHGDITFKLHKSITHDYPFPLPFENKDYSSRFMQWFGHSSQFRQYFSRSHWRPVSSCNGLICLVSKVDDDDYDSYICVYNPVTREYVNLPTLIYEQTHRPLIKTDFGYHPCTKEYKVVQIYYNTDDNKDDGSPQGQVSVYTLGSGSSSSCGWRSKGETDFMLFDRGLLVNGALHWLSRLYGMEIIAFDLADEKFRKVPSPPQPSSVYHSALEVLEGRYLCVMLSTSNENLCSMWVMNQDHRSWTKKYNIALNEPDNMSLPYYRPLAQSKGGNILLHDYKYSQMKIVSSDPKNTSFDDEDVHVISLIRLSKQQLNYPYSHHHEIIPYTKSFVSLKALGEDGARTGKKTKELKRVRGANNEGEEQPMVEKRNKNN